MSNLKDKMYGPKRISPKGKEQVRPNSSEGAQERIQDGREGEARGQDKVDAAHHGTTAILRLRTDAIIAKAIIRMDGKLEQLMQSVELLQTEVEGLRVELLGEPDLNS